MKTLLIICFLLLSCKNASFDKDAERSKILKLHNEQRDHHFNKNVKDFLDQHSSEMLSVNRGKVSIASRTENEKRFGSYFSAVDFVKWDDVKAPIIRFSDDGTIAYTIVEKIVILDVLNQGEAKRDTTEYAWMAVYKKIDGDWKLDAIASTNK